MWAAIPFHAVHDSAKWSTIPVTTQNADHFPAESWTASPGFTGPLPLESPDHFDRNTHIPDILEVSEMQAIIAELQLRERVLLFLDMVTGLRRGELAGLQWSDIDFGEMQINVTRSVVDQIVGRCKTESSQKPVPMDEYTAQDLQEWYRLTPYREPSDWVFASDSSRAGKNAGSSRFGCRPSCVITSSR